MTKLFITGTDTNVGKTYVSTLLLNEARHAGLQTLGIKPVASGGNEDVIALQQASSIKLPSEKINPFLFKSPIAPHLAAKEEKKNLSVREISNGIQQALNHPSDLCVIEGAGGWYVPLNETETMADLVKALQIPVILVVSIKLGCINHSLLTQRAMQSDGVSVVGWIANCFEDTLCRDGIIATLESKLEFPLLMTVS